MNFILKSVGYSDTTITVTVFLCPKGVTVSKRVGLYHLAQVSEKFLATGGSQVTTKRPRVTSSRPATSRPRLPSAGMAT